MRLRECPKLLVQLRVGTGPLLFDFLELAIDARQRFLERLDEIRDGLVPAVELYAG